MAGLQRIVISSQPSSRLPLDPGQSHYLYRVLRLRKGDRFIALDEQDQSWIATLEDESSATIIGPHCTATEIGCRVTLQIAMPKTGLEDIIRQTTELGVHLIQPMVSDRVILRPSAHKLARWQRIAQEAAEQSERQHWPKVAAVQSFRATLASPIDSADATALPVRYLCAARRPAAHLLTHLISSNRLPAALVLAIGPEGGWTDAEIDAATAAGYQLVGLGKRILRAVTAPVAAMTLIAAASDTSLPSQ